jgi:hypothetical protein
MNLSYRPLDINDCEQLIDLLKERPYLFNGYHDPEWNKKILEIAPKWFEDPLYHFPALWVDGRLLGAIIAKESASSPSWTWGHWVGRSGFVTTMYSEEGVKIFKHADNEIFDEMEVRRKLNRFFVSYRYNDSEKSHSKNAGMSDRMFAWMSRNNFRVSQYKFYTDCEVEAGQTAKYAYQRELLGNQSWPFKTVIRLGMLIER